jgi:hypothetical protein
MTQSDAIETARRYLYESQVEIDFKKPPLDEPPDDQLNFKENYHLDRSLQYLLCGSYGRLVKVHGENGITEKDIHLIVEAWINANGMDDNTVLHLSRMKQNDKYPKPAYHKPLVIGSNCAAAQKDPKLFEKLRERDRERFEDYGAGMLP